RYCPVPLSAFLWGRGKGMGPFPKTSILRQVGKRWLTATGAARAAGYAGDDTSIRQAGHRAAHSTAVMGLLSMAKAETGQGPDGNVTMTEAKQILSRLARGSDPNVRIKAIESLAKIERDERELEARQREGRSPDLHQELREIAKISVELAEAYAKHKG